MSSAIQVRELKKRYGSHNVLRGLDFQIEKGEIFALLGVNGYSITIIIFACPYQAYGSCKSDCKME